MRNLPSKIIFILIFASCLFAQSPHGDSFNYDCELCHEPTSWKVDLKKVQFDHSITKFELIGQHKAADCRGCHTTLEFSKINSDCISCHTDLHEGTVGKDCSKCHTSKTWMVEDINGLHQKGRFPLVGNHLTADCQQCHSRYVDLYFEPLNTDCFACHESDFSIAHNPNDSKDCQDCHEITASSWLNINVVHDFFPLVGGHEISDCSRCHGQSGNFTGLSSECFACHEDKYRATTNPDHELANFPTDCLQCHTIYGWSPSSFDHGITAFPLTGAHLTVNCQDCHTTSYQGTPSECVACHQIHFDNTTNPNHTQLGLSTECISCHTTNPDWQPALFPVHNQYYELLGKHLENANDCNSCHNGNYTSTPNLCYDCHTDAYNNSQNPNHLAAGFPTTCEDCHTAIGWSPANFDHDGLYFPIYTGEHAGEWNACADCHEVPNNFSVFTCISCHEHNQQEMNDKHQGVQGYIYTSEACLSCHPDGSKGNAFNHINSNFPLTGAHTTLDCLQCHQSGYSGTPTECVVCHQLHFNNSTNPNHTQLGLSTDCTTCHTTEPDWKPALFPIHNQYFELLGRHLEIANDCASCHNGNYNNTSSLCYDCHSADYNNAQNPNHTAAGIPHECEQCHTSTAWIPSTFNHTLAGFELLGAHLNIQCSSCHEGTILGLNSDCISCHLDDYNVAPNHVAQGFPTNCEMCHNSVAWNQVTFNHNLTNFPLTGAHINVNCFDCHESGFTGTSTICYDCHQQDYQQSSNPSHTALSLPTECSQCHTTNPDWQPATFSIHNQFFELLGAHANITNCDDCHNGNFNNTPNTCIGCHQNDYNGTTDPPHLILNFSYDCLTCHTMNGWIPANFNHSFYPISSDHNNVDCNQCHSEPNYQPQCLSCHYDDFLEEHDPGDPTNCWDCHSTYNWGNSPGLDKLQRND